jgi:hypothetical protein
MGGVDFLLDQRGVGLGRRVIEAVAGGQAVAEEHDRARFGSAGAAATRRGAREETEKENREKRASWGNRPLKLAFVPIRVFRGQIIL